MYDLDAFGVGDWARIIRIAIMIALIPVILIAIYRNTKYWTSVGGSFWWFLLTWWPLLIYQLWDDLTPRTPPLSEVRLLCNIANLFTFFAFLVSIIRFNYAVRRQRSDGSNGHVSHVPVNISEEGEPLA